MKKRMFAALALLLLLTACGGPVAETPAPTPTATPEETPMPTPTEVAAPEPTETPGGSLVYTDWSKLEPYEPKTAVYTRRYEDFTDTVIPADDYGPLLSFAGAALTGVEEWSLGYYTFHLYGLVTLKGEVVLDPVLTNAFYLEERNDWGNVISRPNVMVLGKVFYDGEGWPEERFALCAGDGSWCTDFLYEYNWENYHNLPFTHGIPMVQKGGRLAFLDPDTGEELRSLDFASQVDAGEFSLSGFDVDSVTGWTTVNLYIWKEEVDWGDTLPLLFDPQGNVHSLPDGVRWVDRYGDGLVPAGGHFDETEPEYIYQYGYVDADTGKWALPPIYTQAGSFENGTAWVSDGTGVYLIDTAGTALTGKYSATPIRHGDYWYVEENYSRVIEILDKDMNRVDSPLVGVDSYSCLENGWACGKKGDEWILVRGEEVYRFPDSLGNFWDFREGRMMFYLDRGENERAIITLTDLEGNVVAQWDRYDSAYFYQSWVGEESCYVSAYTYLEGDSRREDFYDLNGNFLFTGTEYSYPEGGLFCTQGDDHTTMTDRDGNVVFRWPFFSGVD